MTEPRISLRLAAAAVALAAAATALAQTLPPAPPPPPIPPESETRSNAPPPPPPPVAGDPELEPQVTITKKDDQTIEEARVNGKLMWVKVTPKNGRPYFLIPDATDGTLIRREGFDPGLKVPLWLLFSF
jgi:hypothetical protein